MIDGINHEKLAAFLKDMQPELNHGEPREQTATEWAANQWKSKPIYTAAELDAMSDDQLANLVRALLTPQAAGIVLQVTRPTIIACARGAMLAMLNSDKGETKDR